MKKITLEDIIDLLQGKEIKKVDDDISWKELYQKIKEFAKNNNLLGLCSKPEVLKYELQLKIPFEKCRYKWYLKNESEESLICEAKTFLLYDYRNSNTVGQEYTAKNIANAENEETLLMIWTIALIELNFFDKLPRRIELQRDIWKSLKDKNISFGINTKNYLPVNIYDLNMSREIYTWDKFVECLFIVIKQITDKYNLCYFFSENDIEMLEELKQYTKII